MYDQIARSIYLLGTENPQGRHHPGYVVPLLEVQGLYVIWGVNT